ncbi:hypothetical protein [Absidia glauca]|uniref:CS domain-containing protein n=1 Tax=Absidia glauca TaxID=4829 RepID=A0A163M240_ABSGL|nr:hypothetical protein [Absidia glauca]
MTLHPTVLWAQRAEFVYLTVELVDIQAQPTIELTADKFHFKGKGEKEQKEYECELQFFKPVDPKKSHQVLTARGLTMIIIKAEPGWWDKLQVGPRPNFLKVDFNRWRDEDEEDEEAPAADPSAGGMPDMANLASMMGGGGAGGGAGGMPDFASMMGGGGGGAGGMPDFASMMGGGGAGGAGGMDFSQLMKDAGAEKKSEEEDDSKDETK